MKNISVALVAAIGERRDRNDPREGAVAVSE